MTKLNRFVLFTSWTASLSLRLVRLAGLVVPLEEQVSGGTIFGFGSAAGTSIPVE